VFGDLLDYERVAMFRMLLIVVASVMVLSSSAEAGGGGKQATLRVENRSGVDLFVVIDPPASWQNQLPSEKDFLGRATLVPNGNNRSFKVNPGSHNVLLVNPQTQARSVTNVSVKSHATRTIRIR
jgi:hypothetical protein